MPYRHAHWFMLLFLAPAIAVAFWRDYFGVLATAPFAFHAHGLTATAWIALTAFQSWTAHSRKFALHRASGRAVLFLAPLFAAAAALVVHSMSIKFVDGHPFYGKFGAVLGLYDIISTIVLVAMVRAALVNRKRVGLHAGYMLGTVLLVFPPVIERLPIPVPHGVHFAEMVPAAIALALYLSRRRDGLPFLIVLATLAVLVAQSHTIGASALWASWFARIGTWHEAPLATGALVLAAAALWSAWNPWSRRESASPPRTGPRPAG